MLATRFSPANEQSCQRWREKMTRPLYQEIALLTQARLTCRASNNEEWFRNHSDKIAQLTRDFLPRGSGFDMGTVFDFDQSTPSKLVFQTSYHHMDEYGGYTRWTDHTITITPDLAHGFNLRVNGV